MPIKVHPSVDPRKAKEPHTLARALELQKAGNYEAAADLYRYLDTKYPPHYHARYLAAMIAREAGLYAEGIALLRDVCLGKPKWAEAWYNLGTLLQEVGQIDEAEAKYRKALRCDPDFVSAHVNLGNVRLARGDVAGARALWDRAIALNPDGHEARMNVAHVLLLLGDWSRGWQEYEHRWGIPGFGPRNGYKGPMAKDWDGGPLAGRSLTVFHEQGVGDTIMCLRYRPLLIRKGAGPLTWIVPPALVRLVTQVFPLDRIVSDGELPPQTDLICPMMSLPLHCGTTVESVPGGAGYIAVTGGGVEDGEHVPGRPVLGGQPEPQERPQPVADAGRL